MKKFFGLPDIYYIVMFIVGGILSALTFFRASSALIIIYTALIAFGYAVIYFILRMYIPYRFGFFDLLKMLIANAICYGIYFIPFAINGITDDMLFIIGVCAVISVLVLLIAGTLVFFIKRAKDKSEYVEFDTEDDE